MLPESWESSLPPACPKILNPYVLENRVFPQWCEHIQLGLSEKYGSKILWEARWRVNSQDWESAKRIRPKFGLICWTSNVCTSGTTLGHKTVLSRLATHSHGLIYDVFLSRPSVQCPEMATFLQGIYRKSVIDDFSVQNYVFTSSSTVSLVTLLHWWTFLPTSSSRESKGKSRLKSSVTHVSRMWRLLPSHVI